MEGSSMQFSLIQFFINPLRWDSSATQCNGPYKYFTKI